TGVHASRVCTHSRSTYSVPMLRRLASTDRTRFFRWLPAELRSPGRVCSVYLVPTTNRSRSGRRKSPRILSALPSEYMFAVSRNVPPASANLSRMSLAVRSSIPQDLGSPKVIVPSANSETRNPDDPSNLYRTSASIRFFFHGSAFEGIPVANVSHAAHAGLAWQHAPALVPGLPGGRTLRFPR